MPYVCPDSLPNLLLVDLARAAAGRANTGAVAILAARTADHAGHPGDGLHHRLVAGALPNPALAVALLA